MQEKVLISKRNLRDSSPNVNDSYLCYWVTWGDFRLNVVDLEIGGEDSLFLLLLYWGYIVTFTKVLTICHSWIHPLHHSPLSSLPTIPGIVSADLTFPFTYMSTEYFHHIYPPTPFPYILLSPTDTNPPPPPQQTGPVLLSCSLFLERTKKTFLFV
jgi:hypothetical protein